MFISIRFIIGFRSTFYKHLVWSGKNCLKKISQLKVRSYLLRICFCVTLQVQGDPHRREKGEATAILPVMFSFNFVHWLGASEMPQMQNATETLRIAFVWQFSLTSLFPRDC